MKKKVTIAWAVIISLIAIFSLAVVVIDRFKLYESDQSKVLIREITVANTETEWKYYPYGKEPDLKNLWTGSRYNADYWNKMKSGFSSSNCKEIGEETNTAFLRTEFEYDLNTMYTDTIYLDIIYSDSIIVYLNGYAIYEGNVPTEGFEGYTDDGAEIELEGPMRAALEIEGINTLKQGSNVIAVELHNDGDGEGVYFYCNSILLYD